MILTYKTWSKVIYDFNATLLNNFEHNILWSQHDHIYCRNTSVVRYFNGRRQNLARLWKNRIYCALGKRKKIQLTKQHSITGSQIRFLTAQYVSQSGRWINVRYYYSTTIIHRSRPHGTENLWYQSNDVFTRT